MTHYEKLAVLIYIGVLLGWCGTLTIFLFRANDRIARLDSVLSQALTALGFPKKDAP